jgi:hypothetical protein
MRKIIAKLLGYGCLKQVSNKNRKIGSANEYIHVKVIEYEGREVDLLFTKDDLKVAKNRAENNKEDYQ